MNGTRAKSSISILSVHFKLTEWRRFFGLLFVPHISEQRFSVLNLRDDALLRVYSLLCSLRFMSVSWSPF